MGFDDIIESPMFWMLGGGGVAAEILGYIMSKRMGIDAFPIWQFIVVIVGTLIAAAVFASQE